ncbi:HAD-IA family hydrolase [Methylibium sp.]|uniref:HAD-IA family hydrolase n=1 Tax=Methylibium sp. TaxID=2067992 RepID=UPI003D10A53C
MTDFDAIAFDLDGTLVDSAPDIAHALNTGLHEAGLQSFDLDRVRSWIGDGPDALIARAMSAQGLDAVSTAVVTSRVRAAFDVITLAAPLRHGMVYDGIAALLTPLQALRPLVVVTNKPTRLACAVLQAAGLLGHFAAVHGADTKRQRKPSPLLLEEAADRLRVSPGRLLMVGDSILDLRAAHAAGSQAALVLWGYGHHAVPESVDAWRVATPRHLLTRLLHQSAPCEQNT